MVMSTMNLNREENILEVIHPSLHLLTAKEATDYLRISLSTLNRMERKGLIVSLRTPGGHRRYTMEMLNACLSRGVNDIE
jgi:excisionase family DNA binding protein